MSLEKSIKAINKFASVTFTGTGVGSISLSDLVSENQTFSKLGLNCVLTDLRYKAKSDILISSNGVAIWAIKKSDSDEFSDQRLGKLPEQDGRSDITVSIEGTEPSVITLVFSKEAGFVTKTN